MVYKSLFCDSFPKGFINRDLTNELLSLESKSGEIPHKLVARQSSQRLEVNLLDESA